VNRKRFVSFEKFTLCENAVVTSGEAFFSSSENKKEGNWTRKRGTEVNGP
jgi:hypothetical protein